MGKLRIEPKQEAMSNEQYNGLLDAIKEARTASRHSRIYWDLEENENASQVRRDFLHVAEGEKINLSIRRPRGSASLEFQFDAGAEPAPKRLPAEESRARIVEVIKNADGPLRKADIVSRAGISPSTWNSRITELLQLGSVKRHGRQRDATYTLP